MKAGLLSSDGRINKSKSKIDKSPVLKFNALRQNVAANSANSTGSNGTETIKSGQIEFC